MRWTSWIMAAAAAFAGAAQAQPVGFHPGWGPEYAYRYAPPIAYGPDGRATPYAWANGFDGFHPPPVGVFDVCATQALYAQAQPCPADVRRQKPVPWEGPAEGQGGSTPRPAERGFLGEGPLARLSAPSPGR